MGKTYDQLDIDECYEICRLCEAGVSIREIGRTHLARWPCLEGLITLVTLVT